MAPIKFFVAGVPKPAGSKRGFFIPKLKRVIITDANPNSKDWKIDVKHAAQKAFTGELIGVPLAVIFRFQIQRPKGHFGSGKNSCFVKASAPQFPASKPDLLKLARGCEDAMTGIIYRDDAQIVTEYLSKRFHDAPGVWIEIREEAA